MMTERRPAQTIGELDIHLGFVMDELRTLRNQLGQLATKAEVDQRIGALEKKIEANAPRSILKIATEVAIAVTAIAAAGGVILAIASFIATNGGGK